ncbi:MAG: fatty-acid--CoA ligase [Planctomycetes bacterium]|nr:fatty-acid--CoA ligase [Planctomycetota bacterium]
MIASILNRAAAQFADTVAVVDGTRTVTYRELADRVARTAAIWSGLGLCPSDRVALLAENSLTFLEAYFAAAWGGFVLAPLNWRGHPEGLARIVAHAEAKLLIATPKFANLAAATRTATIATALAATPPHLLVTGTLLDTALPATPPLPQFRVAPDAPAHLYYTSGTTGDAKGVILTHKNVTSHARMAIDALSLCDRDVWGHIAPMFHLADAWATFAITAVGGRHVMVPEFDPPRVLEQLAGGITITNLVPTMLTDLVDHPNAHPDASAHRYPSLRRVLSGGAPIAPTLVAKIMATFGAEYVQTYGLTETSPYLTMSLLPDHLAKLPPAEQFVWRCKTGRPLAGVEVRVARDDGTSVAADGREVGEIVCRGDSVTPGYWKNPTATAAAFRDGWFRTGDLAVLDHEGFVHIVDRAKDVIKTGGESVFSTEVEAILCTHPSVQEAAVIGLPHARWGEAVVAVVVKRSGATADAAALIAHCRAHLGGLQVPKRVLFQDALPRTGSGKISKRLLRDALRQVELPE